MLDDDAQRGVVLVRGRDAGGLQHHVGRLGCGERRDECQPQPLGRALALALPLAVQVV